MDAGNADMEIGSGCGLVDDGELLEIAIRAIHRHEFLMRAQLGETARFHHDDSIGAADRAETVGYNENRAAFHQGIKRLLDERLAFVVERACGFIENQNPRIFEQAASDGDALALAAGERGTSLSHLRFETAFHFGDEFPGIRQLGGAPHFVLGGIRAAVADIFIHRTGEEKVVLKHDADLLAVEVVIERSQIMAIDADDACRGIIETGEQADERGFSAAARAD